jgi:DNA-binding CsgD family transcriptional regulator
MSANAAHYRSTFSRELTARQRQVLQLLAKGRTNPQIGDELGIGLETVKMHVSEVLARLDVGSREEAAEWWRRQHSIGARLGRAMSAVGGMFAGRAAVASGALVTVFIAAAAAVVLYAARSQDDDSVAATPEVPKSSADATVAPNPRVQKFADPPAALSQEANAVRAGTIGDTSWVLERNGKWSYWLDLRSAITSSVQIPDRIAHMSDFDGRLFTITQRGALLEVDPPSGKELSRKAITGVKSGYTLVVTADSFWVSDADQLKLVRVDRDSGQVIKTFESVSVWDGFASGGGYLWFNEAAKDSVVRIDPRTNELTRFQVWTEPSPRPGDGGCGRCAQYVSYRDGKLWFSGHHGYTQFDPETGTRIVDFVSPTSIEGFTHPPVWASDGSMWVVEAVDRVPGNSYLARVDPGTMAELERIPLSVVPRGRFQVDDAVYVIGALGVVEKVMLVQ